MLQKGLWIIIGTQSTATKYLPQRILEICTEDKWIEINGLSKDSLFKIAETNIVDLKLPEDREQRENIFDFLFTNTSVKLLIFLRAYSVVSQHFKTILRNPVRP